MAKISAKSSIARLVKICEHKRLKYVVISPGSRNAALTISFAEESSFECINIPDERAAAFFALGIAQKTGVPTILCCTSGTAALNYAPAIAEAYHQKVPLLVLTADRPIEWLGQRAGQTMMQKNIYQNYIKASFELIEEAQQPEHLWYNDRIVNEAINECLFGASGPVHINVPMREPLYDTVASRDVPLPKIIELASTTSILTVATAKKISDDWISMTSVLVIVGQKNPDKHFDQIISQMAAQAHVVVLTETTSNVHADGVLPSIDRVIDSITEGEYEDFTPDLIISCGAAIISKKIRFMLRQMEVKGHWHVDPDDRYIDTYQSLTSVIPVSPTDLFALILRHPSGSPSIAFKDTWIHREAQTRLAHVRYMEDCTWSDLQIISRILPVVPEGTLHLASSTSVRYAQLFDHRSDLEYRCNRGVSGIDGCTSTAAGYAYVSEDLVTLITGDIAFFYDTNALWHHHLRSNLRIILINNEGGNIFRYVNGPDKTAHLEQHFEATHQTSARWIAKTHNVDAVDRPMILEVQTPRLDNIEILKEYFNHLRAVTSR